MSTGHEHERGCIRITSSRTMHLLDHPRRAGREVGRLDAAVCIRLVSKGRGEVDVTDGHIQIRIGEKMSARSPGNSHLRVSTFNGEVYLTGPSTIFLASKSANELASSSSSASFEGSDALMSPAEKTEGRDDIIARLLRRPLVSHRRKHEMNERDKCSETL